MEVDEKLSRRLGLVEDWDELFREARYALVHKENFSLPKLTLWTYDLEKGSCEIT